MGRKKEGNVLFNDAQHILFNNALDTFYLRLYGVRQMVKDHSDSERGNQLPPHRLLFPISCKGSFICVITHRITHTTAFVTPVVEHWLERVIASLHGLLFLISSKGYFICTIPHRIAQATAFVIPVVENWMDREMGPL